MNVKDFHTLFSLRHNLKGLISLTEAFSAGNSIRLEKLAEA